MLAPTEAFETPPSRKDGVDEATEEQLRSFGVELIQRGGILLRVPQLTAVSAAALFQRFYFACSLADVNVRSAAAAALLLACKLEEHSRKVADVVNVFWRLKMRDLADDGNPIFAGMPTPSLDSSGRDVSQLKHEVVRTERYILQQLGFEVGAHLDTPHQYFLQYLSSLGCERRTLGQKAWSLLNDSMRTTVCCVHPAREIAAACIFLAARSLSIKLPMNPPWWEAFDTNIEVMREIAEVIAVLYRKPAAKYVAIEKLKPLPPETPLATPVLCKSPSDDEKLAVDAERPVAPEDCIRERNAARVSDDSDSECQFVGPVVEFVHLHSDVPSMAKNAKTTIVRTLEPAVEPEKKPEKERERRVETFTEADKRSKKQPKERDRGWDKDKDRDRDRRRRSSSRARGNERKPRVKGRSRSLSTSRSLSRSRKRPRSASATEPRGKLRQRVVRERAKRVTLSVE